MRVEKIDMAEPVLGSNPSDAPLAAPETYAYDVAVRVQCGTYVGRYENWYDYLPSAIHANGKVEVRLTGGMMYMDVPNGRQLKLQVANRHTRRQQFCNNATN